MKLGDFVSRARKGHRPPVTRPIKFRVLAVVDDDTEGTAPIEVDAVLVLVSDAARNEAVTEADAAVDARKGGTPADVHSSLREFYFLHRCLRDAQSPGEPLADTPEELERMLVGKERERVAAAYAAFVAEEFPDAPTKEQLDKLTAEAGNA